MIGEREIKKKKFKLISARKEGAQRDKKKEKKPTLLWIVREDFSEN